MAALMGDAHTSAGTYRGACRERRWSTTYQSITMVIPGIGLVVGPIAYSPTVGIVQAPRRDGAILLPVTQCRSLKCDGISCRCWFCILAIDLP